MRDAVAAGQMPPWHAEGPHGVFRNDRRLSDADKQTILRWIDAGAKPGDLKKLPPKPDYPASWAIGTPDAVVAMPEDFTVPAAGHRRISVLRGADRIHRRQVDPGDGDHAGRARSRAPRARLRQGSAAAPGAPLRVRRHARRHCRRRRRS